jgi:2,5-furandicarboxylate decarboxylase 1
LIVPKDLRSYLDSLRARDKAAGENRLIVDVDTEVDRIYELPGVARALQEQGRYPTIMFHKVKDSPMRAVTNLLASRPQLAVAMDSTEDRMVQDYIKREGARIDPVVVNDGPVKDVKMVGDEVDLSKVPVVWNCEQDSGPFISASQVMMRDPDTGAINVGTFRMMVHSRNQFGIAMDRITDSRRIYHKSEVQGKQHEVAIFVGHHPTCLLGTQTKVPTNVDTLSVIGGMLQEPLQVTPAETIDMNVPAWAEVVIEGVMPPHERKPEAPYGEYTWYYGLERESPVINVTAVTYRSDAIFHHLMAAHPEHNYSGVLGREAKIFQTIKPLVPSLKAVHLPLSGVCRYTVYVQIKKEFDGQGKTAALAALASDPFIKLAVIVDDDVDIFRDDHVNWAIVTRTQGDKACFFVQDAPGSRLDAAGYSVWGRVEKDSMNTKWAIDATRPVEAPFAELADVPEHVWREMDLSKYVRGWKR